METFLIGTPDLIEKSEYRTTDTKIGYKAAPFETSYKIGFFDPHLQTDRREMATIHQIKFISDDGQIDINQLFRQYSKPLFYYACKFVDEDSAKDIVQDVFLKLWKNRTIPIHESISGLLFTMIRNNCLQQIEKEKVRQHYASHAKLQLREQELLYYSGENLSIIQLELQNKLDQAIEKLPEKCRNVFIMSRFQNKKNREIAEELGITLKAVEKHIGKALQIIRHELKDYLPLFFWLF